MIKSIDEKLNQFFTPTSSRYGDYSIWKEVFAIAVELEDINPDAYFYEIKRLRDLKNTIDYAKEEGKRQGQIAGKMKAMREGKMEAIMEGKMEGILEGKMEAKTEIAKSLKAEGISCEIIGQATGLSIEAIHKL